jgi:2Fe-2S ferredoxin
MRAALEHGVPGIEAECGGSVSCGTCHVFVDEATYRKLTMPSDNEQTMLEFTATPSGPTSRLSCQLVLTEEMDGAVFHIPERQT